VDHGFLHDLVVVFGTALVVLLVSTRLGLPSLVGFLLTGMIVGPSGLALVRDVRSVELLAEVGVIVLLFTVGIEFSLRELLRLGDALLRGLVQVGGTLAVAAGVAWSLGLPLGGSLLVGCVVALSSTAIVMRLLTERAETTTPHGRMALGILILQDLAVVLMILAVPFMAGAEAGWRAVGVTVLKAVGVVALVLLVARSVVPRLLKLVIATRSRELFLLSVIAVCLGTAWLTAGVGLSLGLGAFLAGLVVSESEYSHHAFSSVLPLQDAFSGLFFVSIGMLLDVGFVVAHPLSVVGATLGVMLLKAVLIAAIAWLSRRTLRVGVLTGLLLCQVGEFSFLLLHAGHRVDALPPDVHQLLMALTVLTMGLTPLAVWVAPRVARWVGDVAPGAEASAGGVERRDHVIVVGYGVNGQNVARALRHVEVPYVVLELNPSTVDQLRAEGEPVLFGDATHRAALEHAGVARARAMVVTIPDAAAARRVVQVARVLNPGLHLIVRTRFVGEVAGLHALGAQEVVPEEFETSIEIFSKVLQQYLVPSDVVEQLVRETRQEGYRIFRTAREGPRPEGLEALLADVRLEVLQVPEGSPLAGETLETADLRRRSGGLVLAIRRGDETTPTPPARWELRPGDALLVLGSPDDLRKAGELVRRGRLGAPPPEEEGDPDAGTGGAPAD